MARGRPFILVMLLVLLILLGGAGLSQAAAQHEEGKEPGLLDPRFDLGIWTIVVFMILLLVLRKFAWGPLLEGLKKREHSILEAVEQAKQIRAEQERERADFDQKLAKAYEDIPKIMDEARKDAQNLIEEMKSRATAELQADRQRLHREIETARDQALSEIWTQAAQLATLISAKALGRSITTDDHRRLVDEALAELDASRGQARLPVREA